MNLYHQTGHMYQWNIDSILEDAAGDGLILSPINIEFSKIMEIDSELLLKSFFDPQLYRIDDNKGKLTTYEYFPENIKCNYCTSDFDDYANLIAQKCIDLQLELNFKYLLIPTRYYDVWPTNYYDSHYKYFIEPFMNYIATKNIQKDILLTVLVKQSQLVDDTKKNDLLNWVTGINGIKGIYLLFETNFTTKQIKDSEYLYQALLFIYFLKQNNLEVHIGYCNTESFLFSISNPDSISMGSYENLRNFNVNRFITPEGEVRQSAPRARLYSSNLLQWIDYGYLGAFKRLYSSKINEIFEDSKYKPLVFEPGYNWHFQKAEPYKHYFYIFYKQIKEIPEGKVRLSYIKEKINIALEYFADIKNSGIILDDNSDGSHLGFWLSAINMFEAFIKNK